MKTVILAALLPAFAAAFMAPSGAPLAGLRHGSSSASCASSMRSLPSRVGLRGRASAVPLRKGASSALAGLSMGPSTLFDKIWKDHLVDEQDDGTSLIYIDRHLVHEVTSPQAFEGLRNAGRNVRQPGLTLATVDHNVPTTDRSLFKSVETFIEEIESRTQVASKNFLPNLFLPRPRAPSCQACILRSCVASPWASGLHPLFAGFSEPGLVLPLAHIEALVFVPGHDGCSDKWGNVCSSPSRSWPSATTSRSLASPTLAWTTRGRALCTSSGLSRCSQNPLAHIDGSH
jgi:hypothetical protein